LSGAERQIGHVGTISHGSGTGGASITEKISTLSTIALIRNVPTL